MSSAPHDHDHDHDYGDLGIDVDVFEPGSTLLPNAEDDLVEDPTGTKTVRERETGQYNARWSKVRGILRRTIEDNDALRLRDTDHGAEFASRPGQWSPYAIDDFGTESDAERLSRFSAWLRRVLNVHVLEPTDEEDVRRGQHYSSDALRKAYARGLALANRDLRESSLPDPDTGVEGTENPTNLITRDRHQDVLRTLFGQTYNDVERAVNETHAQTTRELGDTLAPVLLGGLTVRDLAERLVGRVDAVGQTRTATTAHTRVVEGVNKAIVQRGAETGVEHVGSMVEATVTGPHEGLPPGTDPEDVESEDGPKEEWESAEDERVCPRCETLHGQVFRLADIVAGRVPSPPIHPRCRCRWILAG